MASKEIAQHRENAEIFHGDAICKEKSREILGEFHLPKGLLPLDDIEELGCNRSTGFVWLKHKKKKDHKFERIGRVVSYETEVTAFVEDRRMRKVNGVKTKELFIWITIADISIERSDSSKITFATSSGLSKTFPVSAFDLQEE